MSSAVFVALAIMAGAARGDGDDPAAQRALIERDRQSAEFSHPQLRTLHNEQELAHRPTRPDERALQQRERDAYLLREPAAPAPAAESAPLPLPGGPQHGVELVAPPRVGR